MTNTKLQNTKHTKSLETDRWKDRQTCSQRIARATSDLSNFAASSAASSAAAGVSLITLTPQQQP